MALSSPEKAKQFDAYLRWTSEGGRGLFHAFSVGQFDRPGLAGPLPVWR